jgi:hypothetical protein
MATACRPQCCKYRSPLESERLEQYQDIEGRYVADLVPSASLSMLTHMRVVACAIDASPFAERASLNTDLTSSRPDSTIGS